MGKQSAQDEIRVAQTRYKNCLDCVNVLANREEKKRSAGPVGGGRCLPFGKREDTARPSPFSLYHASLSVQPNYLNMPFFLKKGQNEKFRRCRGSNPGHPRDRREHSPVYYNDCVV
jgi:hypothetical protein